jgi:hypothetical protein
VEALLEALLLEAVIAVIAVITVIITVCPFARDRVSVCKRVDLPLLPLLPPLVALAALAALAALEPLAYPFGEMHPITAQIHTDFHHPL